jgi:hypothetical protein
MVAFEMKNTKSESKKNPDGRNHLVDLDVDGRTVHN